MPVCHHGVGGGAGCCWEMVLIATNSALVTIAALLRMRVSADPVIGSATERPVMATCSSLLGSRGAMKRRAPASAERVLSPTRPSAGPGSRLGSAATRESCVSASCICLTSGDGVAPRPLSGRYSVPK